MAYYPERPLEPPPDDNPICPVCGNECKEIYRNFFTGEIIGCDSCITSHDAYDWWDETREELRFG